MTMESVYLAWLVHSWTVLVLSTEAKLKKKKVLSIEHSLDIIHFFFFFGVKIELISFKYWNWSITEKDRFKLA